jgi:ParB family transcriptional regulator, chromosome partitioning protein
MTSAPQKITLSVSRDIPFNKLRLSERNVRRIKAGVSIEQLAEDIARRTLLQALVVRPVLDDGGQETGTYEVPAGGRRYRALELLVRQKRLAKTAPIPCVIRTEGLPEEDSLAENVQRAPLHPLDQFRAFLALREKGQSEEEIAAAFFVSTAVVKQRLRLASVSPRLLDLYAEDAMTLDQLMAFTVSGDHERQEQVWDRLSSSYSKEPYVIRRMLTEGAVRASDKRARFIGEAYEQAGGVVLRDLFERDDGGWLQDVTLVDRLVAERLQREADIIRAEGWKWIEVAPEFPYGHTYGLRQLRGEMAPPSPEEQAERDALKAEYDRLVDEHVSADDLQDEVDQRLTEIEERLAAMKDGPEVFDPAEIARAGAFVSIESNGRLLVERGYVRPEDELPVEQESEPESESDSCGQHDPDTSGDANEAETVGAMPMRVETDGPSVDAEPAAVPDPEEEEEGNKPLPDRLMAELSAHRTLALRHAVGGKPDLALVAAVHALCLKLFYPYALDTCLELDAKSVSFAAQAPGLIARELETRHQNWAARLPRDAGALWDVLLDFDGESRLELFAHCIGLTVNAVHEAYNRRPRALVHASKLADAAQLDMAAAGWAPTVDNYLGRVTKARIVQAVLEARGEQAAQTIASLKKDEMAEKAEELLAGTGWLPEPLRRRGQICGVSGSEAPVVPDAPTLDREADPDGDVDQPETGAMHESCPSAAP